jgi:hypothetical protein
VWRPGRPVLPLKSAGDMSTWRRPSTMHTTLQRLNGASSFLSSALCALAFCIAITSFLIPSQPLTNLHISNFRVYVPTALPFMISQEESKSSQKSLESCRIWLPQFGPRRRSIVPLQLEYKTSVCLSCCGLQDARTCSPFFNGLADKEESNSATIWDKVMNNREEGQINLIAAPPKYRFTDITGKFRDYNATYSLRWNVVPWVGIMQWGKSKEGEITLQQAERTP